MSANVPAAGMHNPIRQNIRTEPRTIDEVENQRPVSARAMETRALVRLVENPHLRQHAGAIHCSFNSGNLSICGMLPTYFLKQQAQESLRTMEGVEQIENRIKVAGSDQPPRDAGPSRLPGGTLPSDIASLPAEGAYG
jgi:osmotically-inducible protein OsmY